jgi:hypothetical protein
MIDYKAIRKWSHEKRVSRLKKLGLSIREKWEAGRDDEILLLLDEALILFLETLKVVKAEKKWEVSGFSLLDGILRRETDKASTLLRIRAIDTDNLVQQYKMGTSAEQKRLKPQLISRGMI